MTLSKQLSLFSVAVLLCSSFVSSVSAEFVTFEFNGSAQVSLDGTFMQGGPFDFTVVTTIAATDVMSGTTVDLLPFQSQAGRFDGATTLVSIPDAGIFNAQATNVTGIQQEGFNGFSRFSLIDPNSPGPFALGLDFNRGGIFADPNLIRPLINPLENVSNAQGGGLSFQFLAGPDVTFNSASGVTVSSGFTSSANVPEPTSFTLCGIGLLAVAFKRRRRSCR